LKSIAVFIQADRLDHDKAGIMELEQIRSRFTALQREHGGRRVAYFDGPGGTQVPEEVIAAMADYLRHHNANTHWHYPTSNETDAIISDARDVCAAFLNARPEEIVFGANMTTLTFHLARALGREWSAGDEVVITQLDHHANVAPWQALARERGITLRTIPLNTKTGQLDLGRLGDVITSRCRLVAVGAASNALGTVSDLRPIVHAAKAVGAHVMIDAVHYAPHFLVDVADLGCDFLACSAYKFYGPHVGILYGRRELLERLDVPRLEPASDEAPERLETGTLNHEGIAGTAAAVRFLASIGNGANLRAQLQSGYAKLHERAQRQVAQLWEGLRQVDGVVCYGPTPEERRTPTVSFRVEGMSSDAVAQRLAERGIFVSNGDFYAKTVVDLIGRPAGGLVRVGCACYTSDEEVAALLDGVREVAKT
jgi:cysteine desulfurase family protein (TIGR01976 family)